MSTTVSYKGNTIATVNNNTKVLETGGTWLEDDITLVDVTSGGGSLGTKSITENGTYNASSDGYDGYSQVTVNVSGGVTPTGTKQISITQNGTTTEDVTNYASAEITVNVSGGGGISLDGLASGTEPSGNITLPTATLLEEYAFAMKKGITGITAPYVTRIKQYALMNVGETNGLSISDTSFPSLTTVDSNGFRNARAGTIKITSSSDILKNTRPFGDNSALTRAEFPNQTGVVGSQCFYSCSHLSILDIGKATAISANAFNGCPLSALIIRSQSVATLNDVSAFNNTPFKSGGTGGTIYVPSSLIETYKASNNWSTVNGYGTITWQSIEGSIYE